MIIEKTETMGIRKWFRGLSAKRESDKITMNPVVMPSGIWPSEDEAVDGLTASGIACVKRCMEIKCGSVASMGLHVEHRQSENGRSWWEREEGHPLERLFTTMPNARQNAYDFVWNLVFQREMRGNAYVIPRRDSGMLTGLVSIPGECTVSYDRLRGSYMVNDPYDNIYGEYDESDIIHFKGYSNDGFLGEQATMLARTILSIARKCYKQQSELFTPGSTLRGFITGEGGAEIGFGGVQDEQLEQVAARIRREIREGSNLGFLPGAMKFVPTGMTPADLQLLESMKFVNLEICRVFGVPPTQVFQDSNVNYKSSETSQTIFVTSTLAPLVRQMEAELNAKLLSASERKRRRIRFDLESYYQSDPLQQGTTIGNLVQRGVLSPNDARERLGLKPIDGGDKLVVIGGKGIDGGGGNGEPAQK